MLHNNNGCKQSVTCDEIFESKFGVNMKSFTHKMFSDFSWSIAPIIYARIFARYMGEGELFVFVFLFFLFSSLFNFSLEFCIVIHVSINYTIRKYFKHSFHKFHFLFSEKKRTCFKFSKSMREKNLKIGWRVWSNFEFQIECIWRARL